MHPVAYHLLATQTLRLLEAETLEERLQIRQRIPKIVLHFARLTPFQRHQAYCLMQALTCCRAETLALECLIIVHEVIDGQ